MIYFLAFLAYAAMAVGINVLVLIHGWGLTPKSWWWIIGVGVFMSIVVHTIGTRVVAGITKALDGWSTNR